MLKTDPTAASRAETCEKTQSQTQTTNSPQENDSCTTLQNELHALSSTEHAAMVQGTSPHTTEWHRTRYMVQGTSPHATEQRSTRYPWAPDAGHPLSEPERGVHPPGMSNALAPRSSASPLCSTHETTHKCRPWFLHALLRACGLMNDVLATPAQSAGGAASSASSSPADTFENAL